MRNVLLAVLAMTGMAVLGTGSAEAAPYRYCLVEAFEAGPGTCYYSTYAQCTASASGRRAYCQLNPFYAFAGNQPVVRPRKVRRHHRYH
ncbi:DUF3551 domain-containing protein [Bradyrhizobium sp. G127]|uniref:DUF3551 domain-containing protein n=1 Tax=Bradyrhizobium sp. G127 TaxID=2904800 RepID=UPI001F3A8831|nr:DUF3551 domain-containing protein [Bradyrhizobium sp. G127]MCF2524159.1 DUF3551 domain-containing protein [Bradyrhizobium sp. G127]